MSLAKIAIPLLCFLLLLTYGAIWQLNRQGEPRGGLGGSPKAKGRWGKRPEPRQSPAPTVQDSIPLIERGLFKVEIPERFQYPPEVSVKQVQDIYTQQTSQYKRYSYQSSDNAYRVGFIRYPVDSFRGQSIGDLLDNLQRAQLEDYKGQLKQEKTSYEPFGVVKRELEIHSTLMGSDLYIRSALILHQPFAFILSYFSTQSPRELYSDKAERFFSSFKLFFVEDQPETVVVSGDNLQVAPSREP